MRRALALARRGQGSVEPNPMVGCVIVRSGRVIGEGYHRRYGGPHAEVHALESVRGSARESTAYVTLEPCCHHGKTPPCTDALIAAGVRNVVAAVCDPFPRMRGQSVTLLRRAGIDVTMGVCETDAVELMAPYLKLQCSGLPWVILKWAQSLDGKIATRTGDSRWISGAESRRLVHQLRGRVDAIVVGINTVLADDPELTCRDVPIRRVASRIVIDPHLRIPSASKLVRSARQVPTIVATVPAADAGRRRSLEGAGIEILEIPETARGLNLRRLLRALASRGMTNVLVEGGGRTAGALYDAGLADEAFVFVSPRLMGGREAPGPLAGSGPARMADLKRPRRVEFRRLGVDHVYRLGLSDPAIWRSPSRPYRG
jgi:diaminohydroxyphosphoribosylaminopyrimidine deaminase/5-amino-6-(5-phosphoribosylamino)uracil reductase